jgi:hypothetical protein
MAAMINTSIVGCGQQIVGVPALTVCASPSIAAWVIDADWLEMTSMTGRT